MSLHESVPKVIAHRSGTCCMFGCMMCRGYVKARGGVAGQNCVRKMKNNICRKNYSGSWPLRAPNWDFLINPGDFEGSPVENRKSHPHTKHSLSGKVWRSSSIVKPSEFSGWFSSLPMYFQWNFFLSSLGIVLWKIHKCLGKVIAQESQSSRTLWRMICMGFLKALRVVAHQTFVWTMKYIKRQKNYSGP